MPGPAQALWFDKALAPAVPAKTFHTDDGVRNDIHFADPTLISRYSFNTLRFLQKRLCGLHSLISGLVSGSIPS